MPIINRVAALHDEITAWRRDIHEHPELLFDLPRTSSLVADKLKEFGVDEIVLGLGKTGVVGVIKGRKNSSGKVIGLRADMDALPINEITDLPYKSKTPGFMHACGHDGHTAMLLGAAKYLAETRNFDGTAIVIFQPAEEGGGGGDAMCKDGLMERFGIQEVYGLHNMPGIPAGTFAMRDGPIMAAADRFEITISAKGGHGAMPHLCIDPVPIAAAIIQATQTIVARSVDPIESAVVSITAIHAGEAFNVIPDQLVMRGTVRTYKPEVQDLVIARLTAIVEGIASAMGAKAVMDYGRGYPPTVNHTEQTAFAAKVAAAVVGDDKVETNTPPLMGAEDFSYMLNQRPGAYVFLGMGDAPVCHHPAYDFKDEIIPEGTSYMAKIVEMAMPA
jgi:amidohydrolase